MDSIKRQFGLPHSEHVDKEAAKAELLQKINYSNKNKCSFHIGNKQKKEKIVRGGKDKFNYIIYNII